ncbi:MAG TPA: ATP-dependent DNA helicase RecG [Acidobacteriaceae bacterium]|nr:ATP-dependent DNA helicase RecG [Acidobacteriaceae bacterium]
MLELSTPVKYVKRIGERIGEHLATRGIHTVEDLLYHLPFRYEDRLNPQPISSLTPGSMASIIGEVRGSVLLRTRSGPMFEMSLGQGISSVKCIWFHGSYLKDKFKLGQMVAVYGKLESSRTFKAAESAGSLPPSLSRFKIIQPQFEILPGPGDPDTEFAMLEMGRIVPVYESLGGTTAWGAKLTSKWMRRIMWSILQELGAEISETLPPAMLERLGYPARLAALRAVHFPEAGTPMVELMSATTPAHRRLIFEELFYLELGLSLKRRRMRERAGTAFATGPKVREALKRVLPFHPTAAQKRVLGEIVEDMRRPQPMRRLLQGDVGSGKTIVAMQAALVAVEDGYQVGLMAPTEILATQHYLSASKLLADAVSPSTGKPYRVALLTGSLDPATKRETQGRIMRGEVQLVIGTHALQEEKADFANLGLVIVDEQHRFGVQQRFRLMRKPGADGRITDPDVLAMTATPIPRTLALTLYGDLEVSVIDEMPPGRTPIVTRRTAEDRANDVWDFVRKQVQQGRQAYLVYPVIEGSRDDQPELDFAHDPEEQATEPGGKRVAKKAPAKGLRGQPKLRSATDMFEELRHGALAGLRLGLLHGRLSADEKEVTMARFKRGEIDVLVSTTVIEVGVDVANASVMVIDHAERFGLAQLHQLRGRVGRGAAKSYCILMTGQRVTEQAEARLNAMVATQNGFELAELDLQQRGPGEFFGTRQTGMPEFRVANLLRDRAVLELAKEEAERFTAAPDPAMPRDQIEAVWGRLKQQWQRRYGLVEA